MKLHPRVRLDLDKVEGGATLRFVAAADSVFEESATLLVTSPLERLFDFSDTPLHLRDALRYAPCLSNGWQSWSFAGELEVGEVVPRARLLRVLNTYTDYPGPRAGRGEHLSNFILYFRLDEKYLVLVSRGSDSTAVPPVSFRLDRQRSAVRIEVLAQHGHFSIGQTIANIELFFADGYFPMKRRLRSIFSAYRQFDRLAFLGQGESLVPGGYESWYNHYLNIDEAGIGRDLRSIAVNDNLINSFYLRRGKPTVFQIDDGWERSVGDWEADSLKFPGGMKVLAEEIEARGMIPGIWIAPLVVTRKASVFKEHPEWLLVDEKGCPVVAGWNPGWGGRFFCLDLSLPEVEKHLVECMDRLIEQWGYRYLKLDFLYAGLLKGARRRGEAAYTHYERVMGRITSRTRDGRGKPLAYLGCGAPLESSFKQFPLMRIGADTRETWEWIALRLLRHQGRPAARVNLSHTIARSLFDGTVFVNDPDVLFCRSSRISLTEGEKELVACVGYMLASQIMFSDDTASFGEESELVFTRRIVDLFDRLAGRRYGAQAIDRDLYRLFSEDGTIEGVINLADRGRRVKGFEGRKGLVVHVRGGAGATVFEPHSISLFEVE